MTQDIKKIIDAAQANYKDIMKGVEFPKIDNFSLISSNMSSLTQDLTESFSEINELEFVNPTYELIEKQEIANALLGQIAENTSVLKELVQINRDTNLNVQELNDLMLDIYVIAKANSKTEADNLFANAIAKISESGEKANNIVSLINIVTGIYNTVLPLL